MSGWRYSTAKEDREHSKLSPEQQDEEQKKFNANPGNRYKAGSAGAKRYDARMSKSKRAVLGGSGGT